MAVFLGLMAVFVPTSSLEIPASIDPQTNSITAHLIAETGSPIAHGYEFTVSTPERVGQTIWLVPSKSGPVSQYPPGAALHAVPLYLLADVDTFERDRVLPESFGEDGPLMLPDMWPAALTSSGVVAGAMVVMILVFERAGLRRRSAIASAVVLALGTSIWSVGADALWQHSPGILWIAVLMWSLLDDRPVLSAIASGMIVLIRPHVALIAGAIALGVALHRRRSAVLVAPAAGVAIGTLLLLIYNAAIFGEWSVLGGYPDLMLDRVLDPSGGDFARNFTLAFIASDRGVLVWSPFVAVILGAIPLVWARTPVWTGTAALGGLAYLAVQYAANRYTGGFDFAFYRYPLEAIVAAAPLGAIGAQRIVAGPRWVAFGFRFLIGLSILAHTAGALAF